MMGGSSKTNSSSTSTKSFKATSQNNPYFTSATNKKGKTVTKFTPGSANETMYNFTNQNLQGLLDSYLNPNMNDPYFQSYRNLHDQEMNRSMQNNVIDPLVKNNMIRSSQATNMYNNLANQSSNYADQLMTGWRSEIGNTVNQLMNMYMQGQNAATGQQNSSIQASLGGGSTTTSTNGKAG